MLKLEVLGVREAITALRAWGAKQNALMTKALENAAGRVVSTARLIIYRGHPAHLKGGKNRLRNSIIYEIRGTQAHVGTNMVYGAIHEFGGVIRPKGHPYLAIPIGDMKGSPRNHPGLRYIKSKKGNSLLVDQSGVPQYLLRREVTIPARPYLQPALEQEQDNIRKAFEGVIRGSLP